MKKAVVLLSGGLDSATVLAIAQSEGFACHALSVDYGQKHNAELRAAKRIAARSGVLSHKILSLPLSEFGGSALTDQALSVPENVVNEGIPITYVPARNTILLSLSLAFAEVTASDAIFVGVNAVDYSGYPDCRPEYLHAFEAMANLATRATVEGQKLTIYAPLMHLSKAEIIRYGTTLGIRYEETVTCYQADEEGRACGRCESCTLRRAGFEAANLPDATRYF